MCIAIWKPQGIELTEETLHNCWDRNPDGAGFMYSENGQLHVVKGLMKYTDFIEAYAPHADKNAVLHFRIATHGGVTPENTHPFIIHDGLAMVHNGIISAIATPDKTKSDTWHFTEMYLKKYHTMWKDKEFQTLVESYIGYSKLIFMDNNGDVKLYNENLGNWNSECWFSNTSWETPKYVASVPKVYTGSWKTPKSYNQYKEPPLLIGDKVTLMYRTLLSNPADPNDGIWYDKDAVVEIKYFGQGPLVTVEDPLNKFSCELATWKIDKVEDWELNKCDLAYDSATLNADPSGLWENYFKEDFKKGQSLVLTKNYNHLRVGSVIVADDVLQKYVISRIATNGRYHSIPKTHLALANELLM